MPVANWKMPDSPAQTPITPIVVFESRRAAIAGGLVRPEDGTKRAYTDLMEDPERTERALLLLDGHRIGKM